MEIVSRRPNAAPNDTICKGAVAGLYNNPPTLMDTKSLLTLELPLVLERLAGHCDFSASRELALQLQPTPELTEAQRRQRETAEARRLLQNHPQASVGAACDVRAPAERSARATVLLPAELLEIKNTLIAAHALKKVVLGARAQFELLRAHAENLHDLPELEKAIGRALDEHGEVLNTASAQLANIRAELTETHERLMQKLERLINNPRNAEYLQEALITQRADRYVVPLKVNFKGRIRGIVHDQSASGATLFIEPLATLELNNRRRELQLAEREEVERVLRALCGHVGAKVQEITRSVEALAALDLSFACARYAEALQASEPELLQISAATESGGRDCPIRLQAARHPLLPPEAVVPIDFEIDSATTVVVITGPNTGGKTVTLKTEGLLALMAACGLQLPVQDGAALPLFSGVFADIGDEQSIEQSLSTFSSHIGNITRMLAAVDARSLVLLDEIGAGTDPGEGSALAQALLQNLLQRRATTLASTHYQRLKVFSHNTPGVINASVDFDPKTLAPVYHLTIGLPGRSNALPIAKRLGLAQDVIAHARGMLSAADQEADALLADLQRQRNSARKEREHSEAMRAQAEDRQAELETSLASIDDERRAILMAAREQAQAELAALRTEIKRLRRRLKAGGLPLQELQQVAQQARALEEKAVLPISADTPGKPESERALRLGDRVRVERLQAEGVVTALSDGEAEVQIGRLRLRAGLDELRPGSAGTPENASRTQSAQSVRVRASSPGMELHLRGQRIEEGIHNLERYLDAAVLAELPWVRIVHGKGTGQMRRAVRDALRTHPEVKSLRSGKPGEGGGGVTVATLEG